MSIPLPYPNINDTDANDVQTWSSSKILDYLKPALETEISETKETTGSLVTFTDNDPDTCAVTKAEIEILFSSDSFSSLTVNHTGKNLFGGTALKDGIVASMPSSTVDPVNKTVTFASNAAVSQRITDGFISGKFKENTQYTFILALEKTTGVGSNLRIYYTDSTYTAIPNISTPDTKEIKTVVSTAGKTVNYLSKTNQAGSTIVYYDESGIFEGVLTEQDFEVFTGDSQTIDLGSTVYGGTFDVLSGTGKAYDGDEVLQDITFTPITIDLFEGTNVLSCEPEGTVDIEITCTDTIGNILKKEGIL